MAPGQRFARGDFAAHYARFGRNGALAGQLALSSKRKSKNLRDKVEDL
jgi:hypothetical protein